LLPLYFPADLPMMGAPGQLSLLGTNSHAMAAAMTEFIVECQPCQDEMKKLNFVYLGSGASDAYGFLTAKPVKTADDLNGIRLRSGGAPWTRLAEHFGAIPVHMSVFDQFEAIRTGVIDGTMTSIVDMQSFHLAEVVKYVTFAPIGMYISTSSFTVSRVTWDELSAEDRAAMARAANHANADFTNRWGSELPKITENAVRKMGIEFVEADPDLIKQIKKFKQADIKTAGEYLRSEFGIQDGPQQIQDYLKLVGKWTKIAKDVNNDPSEMTKRVYDEVWSKIDYATYGD
jgi:TRAP-type C4-dicarboxylate transport system substrate-binding protein